MSLEAHLVFQTQPRRAATGEASKALISALSSLLLRLRSRVLASAFCWMNASVCHALFGGSCAVRPPLTRFRRRSSHSSHVRGPSLSGDVQVFMSQLCDERVQSMLETDQMHECQNC